MLPVSRFKLNTLNLGGFMHRASSIAVAVLITFGFLAGCAVPVSEQSVTAYERARLIVGDGRVIENAT